MINNCPFCKEFLRPKESQFYVEIGNKIGYESRIILETDNWYVIPTLGSLTVGYVLLVAKEHHLSLANLSNELFSEMLQLKENVEKLLYNKLGLHCLAFEHGVADTVSSGANSVDHVHVHILPFPSPIWQNITHDIPQAHFEILSSYKELYSTWQKEPPKSYLLFQDTDQSIYYSPDASNMPSQLFRKCLAPYLKADHWDWRNETYSDNIAQTMKLFSR